MKVTVQGEVNVRDIAVRTPCRSCESCPLYNDPSWCSWYKKRIEDPSYEPTCRVAEITIEEYPQI